MKAWMIAFIVALPVVFIVMPLIKKSINKFIEE